MSIFLSPFRKPKTNKDGTRPKIGINKTPRLIGLLLITIFSSIFLPLTKVRAGVGAHLAHAIVAGLLFLILSIPILVGGAFAKLSAIFMQHTLASNFLPFKLTQLADASGNPTFIGTGWVISRDLSYMIIVIALIAAGLGIALRIFEAQKILAAIVIAAIVIPFTPLICGLVIDPANILTNTFLKTGATTNITSFTTIIKNFGDIIHNRINTAGLSGTEESLGSDTAGRIINSLVFVITIFMIAIAMFLYGVLFIVRDIALSFIVIFSPLAVVASIFPYTKKWFSQWFEQLIGWAFVTPLAVFFLYLTGEMIQTLYTSGGAKSLGLGTMAYFMIPPITMYAGLAAISAAGPAGAKGTLNFGKKGLAAFGKQSWRGTKWVGRKLSASKAGKSLSNAMRGGDIGDLKGATEGRRGLGKVNAIAGYGIRRFANKTANVHNKFGHFILSKPIKSLGEKLENTGIGEIAAGVKKEEGNQESHRQAEGKKAFYSKKSESTLEKIARLLVAMKKGETQDYKKYNPGEFKEAINGLDEIHPEEAKKFSKDFAGDPENAPSALKNRIKTGIIEGDIDDAIDKINEERKKEGELKLTEEKERATRIKIMNEHSPVTDDEITKEIQKYAAKHWTNKDNEDRRGALKNELLQKELLKNGNPSVVMKAIETMGGEYGDKIIENLNQNKKLIREVAKKNPGILLRTVSVAGKSLFSESIKGKNGPINTTEEMQDYIKDLNSSTPQKK